MNTRYQHFKSLIVVLEADIENLTEWERGFLESINAQLEQKKEREQPLSERQAEILERIYKQRIEQ